MQSSNPPRPPYPPRPGASPGESDHDLVAQLGGTGAGAHAVALLMTRHWRATFDYAAICLVTTESAASMVAAAAFHRVLRRPSGAALRPQLLATVRDLVKEWAAQERISALLPELRKPTGGRGLRAARSLTPERRQLAERAFRALPAASQCLLWHIEVEAEPITVPAGLLGVDTTTATAALEQAREQFRAGCVRAHRELAPTRECRYYNRLLDVPIRRGGHLLPDVRQHLAECRYCRHAAEQLSHFEGGLEVLLAETVLGWGARRYLDSRPGRDGDRPVPSTPQKAGGRHRPADLAPRRHVKALAVGVGLTSLALIVTVLAVKGWSEENGAPGPHATWGAASSSTVHPGGASGPSTPGSPSAASAQNPAVIAQARLRNLGSGLCLDLRDGAARPATRTALAPCSSAASQQWSYQDDGLLRSAAAPTLCLDSDPGQGAVALADCLVHAGKVRYDFTVHGELLVRGTDGLAVASGEGDRVVVTERNGSDAQRWRLDTGSADGPETKSAENKSEKGETEKKSEKGEGEKGEGEKGEGEKAQDDSATDDSGRESPDAVLPTPADTEQPGVEQEGEPSEPRYETRYVQADSDDDTAPAPPLDDLAAAVPAAVPAAVRHIGAKAATVASVTDSAVAIDTSHPRP